MSSVGPSESPSSFAGGELFSAEHVLAEGNVRLTATEMRLFPFEIFFPQSPAASSGHRVTWNHSHALFNTESNDLLPPSMRLAMEPGSVQVGKAYVRYEAAADIRVLEEMGVEVDDQYKQYRPPLGSEFSGTTILYERPPVPTLVNGDIESAQAWVMFKDAELPLLDGTLGQRKKRESMREKLTTSSKPLYVYDCHVSCLSDVHRFRPLVLQVKMLPADAMSTTPDAANVQLELMKIKVQVTGHIKAQSAGYAPFPTIMASQHVLVEQMIHISDDTPARASNGKVDSEGVSTSASSSTLHGPSNRKSGPGAIMNAANDWTQTVELDSVLDKLPSSVMTSYLQQTYVFAITCHVKFGGRRDGSFETKFKVKVHPPLASAVDTVEATASTSASNPAAPPSYEQMDGSDDVEVGRLAMTDALPPYEP